MVRFSDMLGNGDADEPGAPTTARDLAPDVDEQPEPDAPPEKGTVQFVDQVGVMPPAAPDTRSPQDVLDRLTQYASSTRAGERAPAPDPPAADPPPPQPPAAEREPEEAPSDAARPSAEEPVGDDLLPRAKRTLRKLGRGDKRRP
jgi:hypothetical protein